MRVKRDNARRNIQAERQRAEPGALIGARLAKGEAVGWPHRGRVERRHPAVVIAADASVKRSADEPIHRLARPERPGGTVAEIDDQVRLALGDVGEDRLEREDVPMDIGDDGDPHRVSRALPKSPAKTFRA